MIAAVNYGLVSKGNEYRLLEEGYDWLLVLVRGKPTYIFKWVFAYE